MPTDRKKHLEYLRLALEIAENCRDIEWYGVGCVIAAPDGRVISTGFTGEMLEAEGKLRHAEDVAIEKAVMAGIDLREATLYSTLEPCSARASGKTPCVSRIISSGIRTVVFGAREPYDPALNIVCKGMDELGAAGVDVIYLKEIEEECLESVVSKRVGR